MNSALNLENLDQIIKDRFDKLKELDYKELIKMKVDPRDIHFSTKPIKFMAFFESKRYLFYVHDLICYCKLLLDIENRQLVLEKEAKNRGLEPPKILRSDLQEILNKGKSLAMRYSMILLEFIAEKKTKTFIDFATFKKENELYEIFILLSVKVAQTFFEDKYHQRVEEEVHRLLRSGAFNESRRRNFEMEKIRRFPILEDQPAKEPFENTVNKLIKRSQLPNVNWNFHYHNQKSDIKPNFIKMKPFEAKNSRSPLLSLVAPSIKFKLNDFEKIRKDKISSVARPISALKARIPGLIDKELQKEQVDIEASYVTRPKKKQSLNKSMY